MTKTNDYKVVLPTDSEAAQFKAVEGWVSRNGRFFGAPSLNCLNKN